MSWNNVKISKILEHNISHPRKAAATKTAALSDLGFSGRGELNKYLCNSAKKNLHRLMAVYGHLGLHGYIECINLVLNCVQFLMV